MHALADWASIPIELIEWSGDGTGYRRSPLHVPVDGSVESSNGRDFHLDIRPRPMTRITACLLTGLLLGMLQAPAQSQEVIEITPRQTCQGCSIQLEPVATLGRAQDPVSPFWYSRVAVDRLGTLFVGPTTSPGEIAVYSPSGDLLRTLGREGEGPGEFHGIRYLQVLGGDSLHVLSRGRRTILSLDGDFIGSSPALITTTNAAVLDDGRVLVNRLIQTPERFGLPAHILGTGGQPDLSFGNDSDDPQGEFVAGNLRTVSYSGGSQVWVGPLGQYRLELWDTAGTHLRTFVRSAPWFKPWVRRSALQPFREKPNPTLLSVREDHAGLLWVILRVPDRNWEPGVEEPAYEHVYDAILEVVDPETGDLLISERFDEPDQLFLYFLSEDLLTSSSVTELGVEQIHVWRFRIHDPNKEGMSNE